MSYDEVILLFCLFAIYILIDGIRYLILYISSKNKRCKRIKGVITKVESSGIGPRGKIHYHVSFDYHNKTYDRAVEPFLKRHKEGDIVTAVINPDNIEKKMTVLVVEDCKIIVPIIFLMISFIFVVLAYIFIKNK